MRPSRAQLRSFVKSLRGDMSPEGRRIAEARRDSFGQFGRGLRNNITRKNLAVIANRTGA